MEMFSTMQIDHVSENKELLRKITSIQNKKTAPEEEISDLKKQLSSISPFFMMKYILENQSLAARKLLFSTHRILIRKD